MNNASVFSDRFPRSLVPTLSLLRRRVGLSREVSDDVVRARGLVEKSSSALKSYFDNYRHGIAYGWYDNGARHWENTHVDGKLHGRERAWHMNGIRWWETTYVNGKMHGLERGWGINGDRWWETSYVDGKQLGLDRGWYEDGAIQWETFTVASST